MKPKKLLVLASAAVLGALASGAGETVLDLRTAKIAVANPQDPRQAFAAAELAKHLNLVSGTGADDRLADAADALLDYRRTNVDRLPPENWGFIFRTYPFEVRWWRSLRDHLKAMYPEMELDD